MATGPLSVSFPQPIGRGMSFRIYRLAEKRHKVRDRKRAFAQTITTPRRRYRGGWPGRNEQAEHLGRSVLRTDNMKERRPNSSARRRRPQRERRNSSRASFSAGFNFSNFFVTCSASPP